MNLSPVTQKRTKVMVLAALRRSAGGAAQLGARARGAVLAEQRRTMAAAGPVGYGSGVSRPASDSHASREAQNEDSPLPDACRPAFRCAALPRPENSQGAAMAQKRARRVRHDSVAVDVLADQARRSRLHGARAHVCPAAAVPDAAHNVLTRVPRVGRAWPTPMHT